MYYIVRSAVKVAWFKIAHDDRSDDDETELAEEREIEKLKQQGRDSVAVPMSLVNGTAIKKNKATKTRPKIGLLASEKEYVS
jgi:hypothetical protein